MSRYEAIQLLVACGAFLLSWFSESRRAMAWISIVVADLVLTTAYWKLGGPYADVVTAAFDFSICISIFFFGKHWWELWLFLLYQFSVLVSIVDLAASIWAPTWIDHDSYSSILEAVNYAAFMLVGGVSSFDLAGRVSGIAFREWRGFRPSVLPLFAEGRRGKR